MRSNVLRTKSWRWLVVCASIVGSIGCQGEPTTVTGLVTLDGAPLVIRPGMRGTVVFQPEGGVGSALSGNIDSAGRYELAAGSRSDVKPSVYWVSVAAVEIILPTADHPETTGQRVTPAKYASATDSGFRVEVGPGPNVVDLQLKSDEPVSNEIEASNAPQSPQVTSKSSGTAGGATD